MSPLDWTPAQVPDWVWALVIVGAIGVLAATIALQHYSIVWTDRLLARLKRLSKK